LMALSCRASTARQQQQTKRQAQQSQHRMPEAHPTHASMVTLSTKQHPYHDQQASTRRC
jgi:hypothetical protein